MLSRHDGGIFPSCKVEARIGREKGKIKTGVRFLTDDVADRGLTEAAGRAAGSAGIRISLW